MQPKQKHWMEKVYVQTACVVAMAAAYFGLWHLVRLWDPSGPMVFLASGQGGNLVTVAGLMLGIGLAAALVTLPARPEAAMLVTLSGLAGVAFRSGPMRVLLWDYRDYYAAPFKAFAPMAAETLLLGLLLAALAVEVMLIRRLAERIVPKWVFREEITLTTQGSDKSKSADKQASSPWYLSALAVVLLEGAASAVLLAIMLRSPERGQVAFALIAAFALSAMLIYQFFPMKMSLPFWLAPVLVAVAVYILGSMTHAYPEGPRWYHALMMAQDKPIRAALPLDWIALGGGGALLGYWVARRAQYGRLVEAAETEA